MSKLNLETPYFNLDLVEKYNSFKQTESTKRYNFLKKLVSTKGKVCRVMTR